MRTANRDRMLLLVALVSLAAPLRAQSINIDFGITAHAVPSTAYGGAANQPGVWNLITDASVPKFSGPLVDLAGQPTNATIAPQHGASAPDYGLQGYGGSALWLMGDEAALHDDVAWQTDAAPFQYIEFRVSGLVDGAYDVYVYGGDKNNCACPTSPQSGTSAPQICYSQGAGFAQGSVWAHLCCTTSAGSITVRLTGCNVPLTFVLCSGMQLVRRPFSCSEIAEPFCSGVAVGATCACPCGNCGLVGRGCENSFMTGGGRLVAIGMSSVSADSLQLQASFLPPTSSALFYQGSGAVAGGFGVVYGDGLRCVNGAAVRLGTRFAIGGVVTFGAGVGSDPLVSVEGAVPATGGTRYYQVWYRNAPVFCTAATVNLTNGFKVLWTP